MRPLPQGRALAPLKMLTQTLCSRRKGLFLCLQTHPCHCPACICAVPAGGPLFTLRHPPLPSEPGSTLPPPGASLVLTSIHTPHPSTFLGRGLQHGAQSLVLSPPSTARPPARPSAWPPAWSRAWPSTSLGLTQKRPHVKQLENWQEEQHSTWRRNWSVETSGKKLTRVLAAVSYVGEGEAGFSG